jgi:hypothetical protein
MKNDLQTFPVSAGLLEPRHVQAIDPGSPWPIYLWFLEHVTRDQENGEDFLGIVLGGRPVSIQQIAEELGVKERACRRHLARLVKAGYIVQKKTGVGTCTYTVTKSKRWAWKRQPRAGRDQISKAPELQTSLIFPGQDESNTPPRQNLVSGSPLSTHQKVVSGSPSTHQKVVSAEGGTRARSQRSKAHRGSAVEIRSTEKQYPPSPINDENGKPPESVPDLARKVIKLLSLTMTPPIIRAIEAAIPAEADFRGCSNVEAAEFITREALNDRRQGIAIDSWYFVETKWRNKSKSSAAAPRPVYGEACEEMQRQQAASR